MAGTQPAKCEGTPTEAQDNCVTASWSFADAAIDETAIICAMTGDTNIQDVFKVAQCWNKIMNLMTQTPQKTKRPNHDKAPNSRPIGETYR